MQFNTNVFVYRITCDGGKLGDCFYVGTWGGANPITRYDQHKTGAGSKFTRKYKPISYDIVGHYPHGEALCVEKDESVRLMRKYGFRRVRGGNMLNMQKDCYTLTALRWWVDCRLQNDLLLGLLGIPDPAPTEK